MEIPEQRIIRLKELIKKEKMLTVEQICKHFDVSAITIRRDLSRLNKEKFLRKVHGGAIYIDLKNEDIIKSPPNFTRQINIKKEEKDLIAKEAAKKINDNDNIIIESGSTCLNIVKYLKDYINLKVSTAGIPIIVELWKLSLMKKDINIGFCGGVISKSEPYIFTGPHAIRYFDSLSADLAFIGTTAVSIDKGISTATNDDGEITKSIIRNSKKVILCTDSSKFEKYSFIQVATLQEIDEIITDKNIDRDIVTNIEKMGVKITTV